MSTRCVIEFAEGAKVVGRVYRHCDGYPEGAGTDLFSFFADVQSQTADTRFGDASYLAAKFVVWLAAQNGGVIHMTKDNKNGNRPRLDFLGVGILTELPSDIEYLYRVHCDDNDAPKVTCWKLNGKKPRSKCAIPSKP